MNNNYIFTADLIAFVEKQDLPPSLYSFVKAASWKDGIQVEKDTLVIILKIREAPDAYHAIIPPRRDGTSIKQVEDRIHKDLLGVVKLSEEAQDRLNELLEKFHSGEFAYFLNCKVDKAKYPYRHTKQ